MTDLDRLRAPGAREDAALRRRYAFRVSVGASGVAGFVLYGILWAFLVLLLDIGVFAAMVARESGKHAPGDARAVCGVVFALAWILFALWVRRYVRRRLPSALPLFEKGRFCDGTLVSVEHSTSAKSRTTSFEVAFLDEGAEVSKRGVMNGWDGQRLVVGATVPVLYLPGDPLCAMFPLDGKMCV